MAGLSEQGKTVVAASVIADISARHILDTNRATATPSCSVRWNQRPHEQRRRLRGLSVLYFVYAKLVASYRLYRGVDKSLARPGRKQTNVSVRMAWISFGSLPCRKRNLMTARISILLKSCESVTCFRACFLPGRAKDLSAPRYHENCLV